MLQFEREPGEPRVQPCGSGQLLQGLVVSVCPEAPPVKVVGEVFDGFHEG